MTISNPLDYHTFSWADRDALTGTFTSVLRCGFDLTALILDYPRGDRCDAADWVVASDALVDAHRATGRPAAVIATLPECLPEDRALALLQAGVVPLHGMEEALAAIEAAAELGAAPPRTPPLTVPAPSGAAMILDEASAKRALAAYGVTVPDGRLVATADDAVAAADALGYPVVLKAVSDTLAHKTERGAVRLNLRDAAQVREAANDLLAFGATLLVESMVTDAVAEVIVGINRDPAIGPYLMLGSGGVLVELLDDSAILMLPTTDTDIRTAIVSLKVGRLLGGYRGRPAGDVAALVRIVLAVQDYAIANLDRLLELDVNPVMVRPTGAVAVDALIRLATGGPMTDAPFLVTRTDGVLNVTLSRGKANAIDAATSRALGDVFARFRDDPEMRVAVVASNNPRFFSAGWDLTAAAAGEPPDADYGVGGFGGLQALPNLNKPVIAAVNGMCVGGGFEIALSADLIIAAEDARFSLPEIKAGTLADAATLKLPRRIPFHVAMDLLFTGRWMPAAEARHFGLVSEVVPAESLHARARERCKPAGRRPAFGVRCHQGSAAGDGRRTVPGRARPHQRARLPDSRKAVCQRGPVGRPARLRRKARPGVERAIECKPPS